MTVQDKVKALRPTAFERTLGVFSPTTALHRMEARHRLLEFEWRAADPGKRRSYSGGRNKNATTQSPSSQRDRIKLMWDARRAYRNMPIMACAVNRLAEYVIPQIMYQAATGDDKLDEQYEAYWNHWATHESDLTGRTDLQGLIKLGFIHMLIDGDMFYHPVHTERGYALQMIESDRVGNIDSAGSEPDPNNIAGVYIDGSGRPLAYDIYDRDKHSRYTRNDQSPLTADQVLPLMNMETADQVRGVTLFCRVIDQINDLYEAFEFERGAAKWAASYAGVVYEKDERFTRGKGHGAAEFDGETDEGTPTQSVQPNKLLRLARGEAVQSFPPSNRPSGAFMALIDATIRDIAMGVDLPFGFFDMRNFGGATLRLEAHLIQRKISSWQNLLVRSVLNPLRDMVFTKAVHTGQLPPVPTPTKGSWTFGPHITADLGYQTNADLALLNANLTSASKLAAAQGHDYKDLVRARAKEVRDLHEAAMEFQVPIELMNPNFANGSSLFSDIMAAQEPPPRMKPTIQQAGDKVSKQVLELLNSVAEGTLPREEAIETLTYVYQMPRKKAEQLVPDQGEAQGGDETTQPTENP